MAVRKKPTPPPAQTPWRIYEAAFDVSDLSEQEVERTKRVLYEIYDLGRTHGEALGFIQAGVEGIRSDQ